MSPTTKTVIDIMKTLLMILMLISPFSFGSAKWGDVYYCEMASKTWIDHGGLIYEHETKALRKFKFILDDDLGAMRFGKNGIYSLDEIVIKITAGLVSDSFFSEGWWFASEDNLITGWFDTGEFYFTRADPIMKKLISITADCDKL